MRKLLCISLLATLTSNAAWCATPDESLIKSCLRADSVDPAVKIREISTRDITEEAGYKHGFDAKYLFTYRRSVAGYALSKSAPALIYRGQIYRLSKAVPVGDNHSIAPSDFDPGLAIWSEAQKSSQRYFCVAFEFDGLGRSGSFQNIHGGYMLDEKTGHLYFAVRDVR